jgi:hypothetical protein
MTHFVAIVAFDFRFVKWLSGTCLLLVLVGSAKLVRAGVIAVGNCNAGTLLKLDSAFGGFP